MKCPKCNGQMRLIGIHGDAKELVVTYQCQADYVSLGRTFSAAGGLLVAINRAAEADWWPMPAPKACNPADLMNIIQPLIDGLKAYETYYYRPAPKADWGGFEKVMGEPPDKSQI
jgi:hypothetical protein